MIKAQAAVKRVCRESPTSHTVVDTAPRAGLKGSQKITSGKPPMNETEQVPQYRIAEPESRLWEDEMIDRAFGVFEECPNSVIEDETGQRNTLRQKLRLIPGGRPE